MILLFKDEAVQSKYFLSDLIHSILRLVQTAKKTKLLAETDQQVGLQYLVRTHVRAHPVVQVEMKALVTDAELELLQETLVFHHVQCREEVAAFLQVSKKCMFFEITATNCIKKKSADAQFEFIYLFIFKRTLLNIN